VDTHEPRASAWQIYRAECKESVMISTGIRGTWTDADGIDKRDWSRPLLKARRHTRSERSSHSKVRPSRVETMPRRSICREPAIRDLLRVPRVIKYLAISSVTYGPMHSRKLVAVSVFQWPVLATIPMPMARLKIQHPPCFR
jgi:hypothetical protein